MRLLQFDRCLGRPVGGQPRLDRGSLNEDFQLGGFAAQAGQPITIRLCRGISVNRLVTAFQQVVRTLGDDLPDASANTRGITKRLIPVERKRLCAQRFIASAKLDEPVWHWWKPSCNPIPRRA